MWNYVVSVDTLYIMGMEEEFQQAREWVKNNLDMGNMMGDVSVFETNIRYVGGLLTAYAFTGDEIFKVRGYEEDIQKLRRRHDRILHM